MVFGRIKTAAMPFTILTTDKDKGRRALLWYPTSTIDKLGFPACFGPPQFLPWLRRCSPFLNARGAFVMAGLGVRY